MTYHWSRPQLYRFLSRLIGHGWRCRQASLGYWRLTKRNRDCSLIELSPGRWLLTLTFAR